MLIPFSLYLLCCLCVDSEYIETALLAQRLGQTPIIIIEKLYEIDIVIDASKKLQIKPVIGVRAKLTTQGTGRWGGSTGDHAKFGLSAAEIMEGMCLLLALWHSLCVCFSTLTAFSCVAVLLLCVCSCEASEERGSVAVAAAAALPYRQSDQSH